MYSQCCLLVFFSCAGKSHVKDAVRLWDCGAGFAWKEFSVQLQRELHVELCGHTP